MNSNDNYFKNYDHPVEMLNKPPVISDTLKMGNYLIISKILKDTNLMVLLAIIVRNGIFKNLKPLLDKDRKNFTVLSAIRELDKKTVTKNTNREYVRR